MEGVFIPGISAVQDDQVALAEARIVGDTSQPDNTVLHVLDVQPFNSPTARNPFAQRIRPLAGKLSKLGFSFILDKLAKTLKKFVGGLGHARFFVLVRPSII